MDQSQGIYEFVAKVGCNDDLYKSPSQTWDNYYKYFAFNGITIIPDNWLKSANELRTIESKTLKYIGSNAFKNAPKLDNILITTNSATEGYMGSGAFYNLQNLRSVTICSVFSQLHENCFSGCSNLATVTFLDSTNQININANVFSNCNQLKTISIARSISSSNFPGWTNLNSINILDSSSIVSIDSNVFSQCNQIKALTILNSLNPVAFGNLAFINNEQIKEITIGRPISSSEFPGWINLNRIIITNNNFASPGTVFDECISSITVEFKPNVVSINMNAFKSWKNLNTINIPATITKLNNNCFEGCSNLELVTFLDSSNSVSIDSNAFSDCNALTFIKIGRPISSLEYPGWNVLDHIIISSNNFASHHSVFSECQQINIEFDPKIPKIADNAFKSWINFKSFTIPSFIIELGESCFADCSNLVSIKFESATKPLKIGSNAFADCMLLKTLILDRPISPASYFPNWRKLNQIIITNDDFTLPKVAFYNCVPFPKIEITPSVTRIKDSLHNQWANVTTIEIQDSSNPLLIDANIFENSEQLNSLKIGRPINSIEFPGWKKLSSITVTSNDFASPFSVFADCDSVSNLVFASSVTMLNTNAFNSWNVFKAFTIPSSITVLKRGCFAGCSNLVSLTFAESKNPISIEADAFASCEKLTNIVIGRPIESAIFPGWTNVNKILITSETFTASHEIFDECTFDTDIEFAPNVHNLGFALFYSWANLKSIIIPSTVKSIVASCFINCMSLESVTFAETPSKISIETNAFDGCDMLETVTIGRPISSNEFPGWSNLELAIITSNYFEAPFIVFSECKTFPGMYFDKSVSSIRPNAFKSWQNLSFLANSTAMLNIERIGSSAFRGASSMEVNLIHCTGLQSIGEFAFAEMPNLLKVSLPPKTSIGVGCFANCPILSDVSLPSHLSEISDSSFENCERIVSIAIPPSVESIGMNAFSGSGIEWVRIWTMATVQMNAFANCMSLASIELWDYAVISKNAFSNSNNIKNVVMYEFVTIDNDAFSCRPKFSYFGQANASVALTENTLKSIRIESIDVTENYLEDRYCGIFVNRVKVNTPSCEVEYKCSSAPFYDDYLRQALSFKRSQIKMFCLLHKQND